MGTADGWNTAVGLAADLQLVAAVPVAQWVEYITPAPYVDDLVEGEPFGALLPLYRY